MVNPGHHKCNHGTKTPDLFTVLVWGAVTASCYAGLFIYADDLVNLAQTTTSSCRVGSGAEAEYFHQPTPELCAEVGGTLLDSSKLNVLVPIAIVFLISYIHGTFTSLFWEIVGFRAAKQK